MKIDGFGEGEFVVKWFEEGFVFDLAGFDIELFWFDLVEVGEPLGGEAFFVELCLVVFLDYIAWWVYVVSGGGGECLELELLFLFLFRWVFVELLGWFYCFDSEGFDSEAMVGWYFF